MTRRRYVKLMRAIIYAYGYGGRTERFFSDLSCDSYSDSLKRSYKYVAYSRVNGLSETELLQALKTRKEYLGRARGCQLLTLNGFYGMVKQPLSSYYGVSHYGR